MAYLITYSQQNLFANTVTEMTPAEFLLHLWTDYPNEKNILHFAIEISDDDYAKTKDYF